MIELQDERWFTAAVPDEMRKSFRGVRYRTQITKQTRFWNLLQEVICKLRRPVPLQPDKIPLVSEPLSWSRCRRLEVDIVAMSRIRHGRGSINLKRIG